MAIRAYKLAEELGIGRSEIVEKASAAGVTLATPMALVDDEQAQLLRERLGAPASKTHRVVEQRVQAEGGAVIRRRRKVEAAPPPPAPAPAPPAAVEPERKPLAPIELPPPPEPLYLEPAPAAPVAELPAAAPVAAEPAAAPLSAAPAARAAEAERPRTEAESERPRRTAPGTGGDAADRAG